MPEGRGFADRLFWKAWFILYAGFTVVDLLQLVFSGEAGIVRLASSLMGLIAAVPLFGYAFRSRLGLKKFWQLIFGVSAFASCWIVGSSIIDLLDQDRNIQNFWVVIFAILAALLIYYPWFIYAFRAPEIWQQKA